MSFAEDMGHDMPMGYEDYHDTRGKYSSRSGIKNHNKDAYDEVISEGITVAHSTDKARLIEFKDGRKAWIPNSQSNINEKGTKIVTYKWLMDNLTYVA